MQIFVSGMIFRKWDVPGLCTKQIEVFQRLGKNNVDMITEQNKENRLRNGGKRSIIRRIIYSNVPKGEKSKSRRVTGYKGEIYLEIKNEFEMTLMIWIKTK